MFDHPLFPPLGDEEQSPDVVTIHVTRHQSQGQVWHRKRFGAEELTELDQIHVDFGGGRYELIGKNERGKIVARRVYVLDGRPKPLNPTEEDETDAGDPPAVAAPLPTNGHSGNDQTMQMFMSMMNMMSQQMIAAQSANTQLLQAMLAMMQANTNAHVQTMAQTFERGAQNQTEVMRLLAERHQQPEGSSAVEALTRGIELGQQMQGGADDGLEEVASIATALTQGIGLAKASGIPPPHAPGQVAPQS